MVESVDCVEPIDFGVDGVGNFNLSIESENGLGVGFGGGTGGNFTFAFESDEDITAAGFGGGGDSTLDFDAAGSLTSAFEPVFGLPVGFGDGSMSFAVRIGGCGMGGESSSIV